MKDLRILYTNKKGTRIFEEYDTIMDFTDPIQNGEQDINSLDGHDVFAEFFENSTPHRYFDTLQELYTHCINIMK